MPADTDLLRDWEYEFDAELAQALMKVDPKLSKMRFLLVPYKIKEDPFWKNYFARIYIIKSTIIDPTVNPKSRNTELNHHSSSIQNSKPISHSQSISQQSNITKNSSSHSLSNVQTKKEQTEIDEENTREEQLKKELEDLGEDFLDLELDIDDIPDDGDVIDLDDPELDMLLNS